MVLDFDALLPPGQSLWPHQSCGVATALIERRTILGDAMGLGKTVQALISAEAAEAYPVAIACPASLKDNWAHEITRFLPHRESFIAAGQPADHGAEINIVSYNLLQRWLPTLTDVNTVILDESHYCNNLSRRRSRSALALARRVPADGLVLALTGTPFVNKPAELVSQLRLIGRLHAVTPQPADPADERAWVTAFREEWCKDEASLRQLHRLLCQTCYIRRGREVIGHDGTRRNVVRLSLDGALAEYYEAENDLIRYLAERDGLAAPTRAGSSGGLSRLSHLRRLVGEAKIWAAREWADNFLRSNPGRSLVVLADHRAVQQALVEYYDCPHILDGEPDVEDQERRFQSGQSRVIVAPLSFGGECHALTGTSDVLFVELGWAPGQYAQDQYAQDQYAQDQYAQDQYAQDQYAQDQCAQDQCAQDQCAQDQCAQDRYAQEEPGPDRAGQTGLGTFAWYLLGAKTIDEGVWKILERKRAMFRAGAEGRAGGKAEELSTALELLDEYRFREPHVGLARHPSNIIPFRGKAS
jgi:hypothetical protein